MSNQNKDSTIYDRRADLNNFILPYFKNARIADLTPERLYEWRRTLEQEKPAYGQFLFVQPLIERTRHDERVSRVVRNSLRHYKQSTQSKEAETPYA